MGAEMGETSKQHSVDTVGLGYRQIEGDGSRVKFDNGNPHAMINLHKPHPGNELKAYVKRQVIEHLKAGGSI